MRGAKKYINMNKPWLRFSYTGLKLVDSTSSCEKLLLYEIFGFSSWALCQRQLIPFYKSKREQASGEEALLFSRCKPMPFRAPHDSTDSLKRSRARSELGHPRSWRGVRRAKVGGDGPANKIKRSTSVSTDDDDSTCLACDGNAHHKAAATLRVP